MTLESVVSIRQTERFPLAIVHDVISNPDRRVPEIGLSRVHNFEMPSVQMMHFDLFESCPGQRLRSYSITKAGPDSESRHVNLQEATTTAAPDPDPDVSR